jgi:hypothetical protein
MAADRAQGRVVPRSRIRLGVAPTLRALLAHQAAGRAVVIDYFASRRCGVVIGDLTGAFADRPTRPGYVELAAIEDVAIFAEARLLPVLEDAGATLHMAGPPFARHLAVSLDAPERWIDFLERPGILAGKGLFGRRGPAAANVSATR